MRQFSAGRVTLKRMFAYSKWMEDHDKTEAPKKKRFRIWNRSEKNDKSIAYITDVKKVFTDGEKANLVCSALDEKKQMHAPCIDIDLPVALVQSRTEGHYHLFIDTKMTWDAYKDLLEALFRAGIIEYGYWQASVSHGASFLRKDRYDLLIAEQENVVGDIDTFFKDDSWK